MTVFSLSANILFFDLAPVTYLLLSSQSFQILIFPPSQRYGRRFSKNRVAFNKKKNYIKKNKS